MMDSPTLRIGWLKMLLVVFRRHGRALYGDLIDHADRMIADAEREKRKQRERKHEGSRHVR